MSETKYKWFWAIVIVAIIVWASLPEQPQTEPETRTKVFCAAGRLFIQFEEKYNTWGTILLDNNGVPILCDENKKLKLKDTI